MRPLRTAVATADALALVGLPASPALAAPGSVDEPPAGSRTTVLGEQCFSVPPISVGGVQLFAGGRYCVVTP